MKKLKSIYILPLLSLLAFAGCERDPDETATMSVAGIEENMILIPAKESNPMTLTLKGNQKWQIAKTDLDWVTVSPVTGPANAEVPVVITPKINEDKERSGKLRIRYGGQEMEITVTQEAATPEIVLDNVPEDKVIELSAIAADPYEFTVRANVDWTLAKTDLGWATVTPESGQAHQIVTVVVTPENNIGEERTGTITITGANESVIQPITVRQLEPSLEPEFTVTGLNDDKELVFQAGYTSEKTFDVIANFDWKITGTVSNWTTVTPLSGKANEKTTVTVSAPGNNTTGGERNFTLNLAADGNPAIILTYPVKVLQRGPVTLYTDDFGWSTYASDQPFSVIGLYEGGGVAYSTLFAKTEGYYLGTDKYDARLNNMEVLRGYTRSNCARIGNATNKGRYSTPWLNKSDAFEPGMGVTVTFKLLNFPNAPTIVNLNLTTKGTGDYGTAGSAAIVTGATPGGELALNKLWESDPFQTWYEVTFHLTAEQVGDGDKRVDIVSKNDKACSWYIDDYRITSFDPNATEGVVMQTAPQVIFCRDVHPLYVSTNNDVKTKPIEAGPASFDLTVDHNIAFAVTEKPAWLTVASTSAPSKLGGGQRTKVSFTSEANTGGERTGTVVFKNAALNIQHSITVVQAAGN